MTMKISKKLDNKKKWGIIILTVVTLIFSIYAFNIPVPFRYYTKGTNKGYLYKIDRLTGNVLVVSPEGTLTSTEYFNILSGLEVDFIADLATLNALRVQNGQISLQMTDVNNKLSQEYAGLVMQMVGVTRNMVTVSNRLENDARLIDNRLGKSKTRAINISEYAKAFVQGFSYDTERLKCIVDLTYPQPVSSCNVTDAQMRIIQAATGNIQNFDEGIYSFIEEIKENSNNINCTECNVLIGNWINKLTF